MTKRRDGDDRDEQFAMLFHRNYARLVRFYKGYRLTPQDASDLAQEAFAKFYEKFDQYRGEAEWGYVQKIGRNLLINWWRDRSAAKRSGTHVDIEAPGVSGELPTSQQPDYASRVEEEERLARLHDAIRGLPEAQSQVLRLQMSGLSYEQIASTLRVSVDAVKSRRRDALRALKSRMGRDVMLPEDEE